MPVLDPLLRLLRGFRFRGRHGDDTWLHPAVITHGVCMPAHYSGPGQQTDDTTDYRTGISGNQPDTNKHADNQQQQRTTSSGNSKR